MLLLTFEATNTLHHCHTISAPLEVVLIALRNAGLVILVEGEVLLQENSYNLCFTPITYL